MTPTISVPCCVARSQGVPLVPPTYPRQSKVGNSRGERVTVTGYPAGSANDPITCTTKIYLTDTFPAFDCRGYVSGTSGSPWLRATGRGTEIVGLIGGLNQGGCRDSTSYSPPLDGDADDAYLRASNDAPADVAPQPGQDGC